MPGGTLPMQFLNEAVFFEKRGDHYIFRANAFGPGYNVSEQEKDRLFAGFKRLQWQAVRDGGILVAVLALLFASGTIPVQAPLPWFVFSAIGAVAALAVIHLFRRDEMIESVLGSRRPEVPKRPLREALTTPRAVTPPRFAIPVLRSVMWMFGLATLAADGCAGYVFVTAWRVRYGAGGAEAGAAAERLLALTWDSPRFWILFAALNLVLPLCLVLLRREIRRIRDLHTTV